MDMPRNETRPLNFEEFSTPKHLEKASEQARQRNYQDFLIVDVDSHHYENENYAEVFKYIESPVLRREAVESGGRSHRPAQHPGRHAEPRAAASPARRAAASRR